MQSVPAPPQPAQPQPPTPQGEPTPKAKNEDSNSKLASGLIKLASNAFQLYIQSHLIHLNYEGNDFLEMHRFFKKEYKRHTEEFDKLSEYVRSLDYLMPMCHKGLLSACKSMKMVDSYKGTEMLVTYLSNLEEYGFQAKGLVKIAAKCDAPDIENYAAELVGDSFTSAWMIKASLR
jgi:starvation-inducible DNA-binding protein